MAEWSFSNLNLSPVQAATGGRLLEPGRYTAKIIDAELKENKGNQALRLKFSDVNSGGMISTTLNVKHDNDTAQRIGLSELKALLVGLGRSNVDNPGPVKAMVGGVVGIMVSPDTSTYRDSQGQTKSRRVQVAGFFDPATEGFVRAAGSNGGGSSSGSTLPDDAIPF